MSDRKGLFHTRACAEHASVAGQGSRAKRTAPAAQQPRRWWTRIRYETQTLDLDRGLRGTLRAHIQACQRSRG